MTKPEFKLLWAKAVPIQTEPEYEYIGGFDPDDPAEPAPIAEVRHRIRPRPFAYEVYIWDYNENGWRFICGGLETRWAAQLAAEEALGLRGGLGPPPSDPATIVERLNELDRIMAQAEAEAHAGNRLAVLSVVVVGGALLAAAVGALMRLGGVW
jgi:hypothetical protein